MAKKNSIIGGVIVQCKNSVMVVRQKQKEGFDFIAFDFRATKEASAYLEGTPSKPEQTAIIRQLTIVIKKSVKK
jgi:hypothetical protein